MRPRFDLDDPGDVAALCLLVCIGLAILSQVLE